MKTKKLKLTRTALNSFNNKMNLMDYRQPFDGMLSPDVYELSYTNKSNTNEVVLRYDENDNILSVLLFTEGTPLGIELLEENYTLKDILGVIQSFNFSYVN